MSLDYIRKTYGVPAKRGQRVRFTYGSGKHWIGRITAASGGCLMVKPDDREMHSRYRAKLHPTWNIEYLSPGDSQ